MQKKEKRKKRTREKSSHAYWLLLLRFKNFTDKQTMVKWLITNLWIGFWWWTGPFRATVFIRIWATPARSTFWPEAAQRIILVIDLFQRILIVDLWAHKFRVLMIKSMKAMVIFYSHVALLREFPTKEKSNSENLEMIFCWEKI